MSGSTDFLQTWAEMSARQRLTSVAVILGVAALVFSIGVERRASRMDFVRRQFHLADAVSFASFSISDSKRRWPQLSGIVKFSDSQYRDYVVSLDGVRPRKPARFDYRGIGAIDDFSSDAFRWRSDPPAPRYAGDRIGWWGSRSMPRIYALKDARYFCIVVINSPVAQASAATRHRIVACGDLSSSEEPLVIVKGVLDAETRALHWIVI